jgi:hypothetical protein
MWDLTTIAVAFLVVSAGVIALARSTTARWERERRAERAHRHATSAHSARRTRVPARLGVLVAAVVVRLAATPVRVLRRAVGPVPTSSQVHGGRGPTSARRPEPAEDPSVDGGAGSGDAGNGDVGNGEVARVPGPPRRARVGRRVLRQVLRRGLPRHGRGSAVPRRTHRLAARLMHRGSREQTPRVSDEHSGPAA